MRQYSPWGKIAGAILFLCVATTATVAAPTHAFSSELALYHQLQHRLNQVTNASPEATGLRLLLSQLYIRMNMLQAAANTLDSITGDDEVSRMREMGQLLLLRRYQQQGDGARVEHGLARLRTVMTSPLEEERRHLLARVALKNSDLAGALQHYRAVRGESGTALLAQLNRASLLLRVGREEHALALLQGLGEGRLPSPAAAALQDRASLLLGYFFLQRGDHRVARQFLQRVRLQSPYRRSALLALGWCELTLQGAEYAIAPWMELLSEAREDSLEDEARLAVAAAVASKGPSPRVILHYRQLLVRLENKRAALREQQQFFAANPTQRQLAARLEASPGHDEIEAARVLRRLLWLQRQLPHSATPPADAAPFMERLQQLLHSVYAEGGDSDGLQPDHYVAQHYANYLRRHHQRAPTLEGEVAGDYDSSLREDQRGLEREVETVAQWYRRSQLSALQRQDAQLDAYMERARLAIARSHDQALSQQVGE